MKKGSRFTIESRKKLSISHLGQIPWNKGLIGQNKQERISFFCKKCNKKFEDLKSRKRIYCSRLCAFAGSSKKVEKTCLVCSKKFLVHPYRKAKFHSRKCYAEYRKTLVISKETRKKMSKSRKKLWQDKEYQEKQLTVMLKGSIKRPTSLEKQMIGIIDKHNLPYKYTGDFSFWIGGKNPDFVNINGEKKLIEVGNPYHHQGDYAKKRRKHFANYGWESYIFIANRLNEQEILSQLDVLNFIITRKDGD